MKNIELIIYCLLFVILEMVFNYSILSDEVIFKSYDDIFTNTRIESLLKFRNDWLWVTYLIKLLFKLVSLFIISSVIYLGIYLAQFEIEFQKLFKLVVLSDFLFFIPLLVKIIWFSYHPVSLDILREFYPLSLFSLFDPSLLQEWLYYPFKVFNVFEVAYWILLSYLLAKYLDRALDEMLKIVLGYYVSFLFCWVVFVMFISLGNS